MSKTFLLVLAGECASGKDSVMNELINNYGYHKMISYTTRPMRNGEMEGRDYFFLNSNEEFDELLSRGELFEKTSYQTNFGDWYYGIGRNSIKEGCVNAVILNPHGIEQLKEIEEFKNNMLIVYITAETMIRIKRYLDRDEVTDKHKVELIDRLFRDDTDFNCRAWDNTYHKRYVSVGWTPKEIAGMINKNLEMFMEVN